MKLLTFVLLFISLAINGFSQSGSDIYLFNFRLDDDNFYISNANNITNTPGYDNQPFFTPDGKNILYASSDGFDQTDIFKYSLVAQSERRLTFTPESEYSPTVTPDGQFISCVILNKTGDQKLYKYPKNGAVPRKVSKKDKVGYHTWLNDTSLYVFVVGKNINTLESIELPADKSEKIADNPGVTLQKIPGTEQVSFVDMSDKKNWEIKAFDPVTKEIKTIVKTVNNVSEYYCWTPTGVLLSGDGTKLYKFNPNKDENWVELADLTDYGIKKFTRLAVSPKANLIAIVVSEE